MEKFDELNELDYKTIIFDSVEKHGKLTQYAINQLFQRDDCFVISKKNGWKNEVDLKRDISSIFDRNMEIKYISVPEKSGILEISFINSTIRNYYDDPDNIVILGDSYNIIGSYI